MQAIGKLFLLLFAFGLSFGGGLTPKPAQAGLYIYCVDCAAADNNGKVQEAGNWLKNLGLLGDVITGVKKLYTGIVDWFSKWRDKKKEAAAVETSGQQAVNEARNRYTGAILDAGVQDVWLQFYMRLMAKTAPARNEYLCKVIMIHQDTTDEFYKGVARYVASAGEHRDRFYNSDGNGPAWAAESLYLRKQNKFGSIDAPSSWQDTSSSGTNGRKIQNADLSASTMDGEQRLEFPKLDCSDDGQGVTTCVPNPQNVEQRFWVAAFYHCLNAAGPRPTPKNGDAIITPSGLSQRAAWDSLASGESSLAAPCAELLAYYTSPGSDFSDLQNRQNEKCKAAVAAKVIKSADFNNCSKGLSKFQDEYIDAVSCKAPQYFLSSAHAHATDPQLLDAGIDCSAAYYEWLASIEMRKKKMVVGTRGLAEMASSWASLPSGGSTSENNKGPEASSPRHQARAQERRTIKEPKVEKIKGPVKTAPREGEPVSADEITLPEAIAQ